MKVASGPTQPLDEGTDLGRRSIAQGSLDELKAGRPAIDPSGQVCEDVLVEGTTVGVPEQPLRLAHVKAQVVRAELGHGTDRAKPSEREAGRAATGEDDREALGSSCDELIEHVADLGHVIDLVVVVEDEDRATTDAERAEAR